MKLNTDTFIGAKFDNDTSTFFVGNPEQFFFLFQNLIGRINSYSSNHFIWTSPWLDWKTFFLKLLTDTFEGKNWQRLEYFFHRQPRSKTLSISEPTRMHTLLLKPSFHLNKSMTRLKNTFRETEYRHFYRRTIWQRHEYFLRRQPRANFFSVSEPNRMQKLLL